MDVSAEVWCFLVIAASPQSAFENNCPADQCLRVGKNCYADMVGQTNLGLHRKDKASAAHFSSLFNNGTNRHPAQLSLHCNTIAKARLLTLRRSVAPQYVCATLRVASGKTDPLGLSTVQKIPPMWTAASKFSREFLGRDQPKDLGTVGLTLQMHLRRNIGQMTHLEYDHRIEETH